ncbi:MAG: hypothetical protein WAK84_15025 [Candidatus Cybelea sp.]
MKLSLCFFLASLLSIGAPAAASATQHDGAHDFDFEVGTWNIAVRRLQRPLTGSTTWTAPAGYVHVVRKLWDGRASLAELENERTAPHYIGMMLRLYDPQSQQWSIYWAGSRDGAVDPPLVGSFQNGRGEFFNQELVDGKPVYVRVVYSEIAPESFHTEQSFSVDGGKTWETNLIQTFIRRSPLPQDTSAATVADPGHQHDFDFEFGSWTTHLRRLVHPLSGSGTWIDLDGTSVVHKIWNGSANVGELEVANATSSIEGLTLRLYNPATAQWSIYFANSAAPSLGTAAMVGRFSNGRGEFYDQELFNGKAIFVRFTFDEITPHSFRLVQSFSADGGRTWEPNWIASFARTRA